MKAVFSIIKSMALGILFSACVSLPKTKPAQVPQSLVRHFSFCSNLDGGVLMVISKAGKSIMAVNMDWLSKSDNSWVLEGGDAFGSTLFRLEYDAIAKTFTTTGLLSGRLDLKTHENGHLVVDGFELGLRPEEIPCLLNVQWPKKWLSNIEQVLSNGEKESWDYLLVEDSRTLLFDFDKPYEQASASRLELMWSGFAGLVNHRLFATKGDLDLTLRGYKDYEIYLKETDSQ